MPPRLCILVALPPEARIGRIFRDESGQVVAKLRDFVRDYPPDDAAEEILEQITDFVEDHPVIK